ncbi:hypothetical protein [Cytobacillus dafuensis]|nr:hypothetical protein [Cytobacillus dafuensis]
MEQVIDENIPIFEKEELRIQKSIPNEDLLVTMDVGLRVFIYENKKA